MLLHNDKFNRMAPKILPEANLNAHTHIFKQIHRFLSLPYDTMTNGNWNSERNLIGSLLLCSLIFDNPVAIWVILRRYSGREEQIWFFFFSTASLPLLKFEIQTFLHHYLLLTFQRSNGFVPNIFIFSTKFE